MSMQINVSLNLHLGPRLIRIGDKVLGQCDGLTISVTEATPEELIKLKNADVIELVKVHQAELEK